MIKVYIEFHRNGTGEPFLMELNEIKGLVTQGIVIDKGEVVHTEETYEDNVQKLGHSYTGALILRSKYTAHHNLEADVGWTAPIITAATGKY